MASIRNDHAESAPQSLGLREVFSDFNVIETLLDGRVRIPLGDESVAPDLHGLVDGQTVLVLYPDEVQAVATVVSETEHGVRYWYAVAPNRDAIRNIHPEALAEWARRSDETR